MKRHKSTLYRERKARGNVFPEAVSIKHRPKSVNQREEFGHWEAGLMIFRRETGNANVATVIERVSRYTVLFKTTTGDQNPL